MYKLQVLLCLVIILASTTAFVPASPLSRPAFALRANDGVERGVSIDQDGKSNVWAIEPKEELESKSGEEKAKGALLAVGGLGAFGAAAFAVLTNLPDPNQF